MMMMMMMKYPSTTCIHHDGNVPHSLGRMILIMHDFSTHSQSIIWFKMNTPGTSQWMDHHHDEGDEDETKLEEDETNDETFEISWATTVQISSEP